MVLAGVFILILSSGHPVPHHNSTSAAAHSITRSNAKSDPEAVQAELQKTSAPTLIETASPSQELEKAKPSFAAESPPIQLNFPTPNPPSFQAYHPPLYPIPWAPAPYDHFYFTRPIAADEISWPLPDYRYGGIAFRGVVHTGIDIPADPGTDVLAAGSGKVTWAGYGLYALKKDPDDPYGLAVAIRHDFGFQGETLYTVYGHMQEIFVAEGQHVSGGEVIGLVGSTGKVTGPHLHFEVRAGKNNFFGSRNPELWLSPPQGWGVLVGRVMNTAGDPVEGYLIRVLTPDGGKVWEVRSYGGPTANPDEYYQENLVLGDLPAGDYKIWAPYAGSIYDLNFTIYPGKVTYFTFQGKKGYRTDLPPFPMTDFVPR